MCLALTLLYYIISAIKFWISDNMIKVLKQEEAVVFVCFALISITGTNPGDSRWKQRRHKTPRLLYEEVHAEDLLFCHLSQF